MLVSEDPEEVRLYYQQTLEKAEAMGGEVYAPALEAAADFHRELPRWPEEGLALMERLGEMLPGARGRYWRRSAAELSRRMER